MFWKHCSLQDQAPAYLQRGEEHVRSPLQRAGWAGSCQTLLARFQQLPVSPEVAQGGPKEEWWTLRVPRAGRGSPHPQEHRQGHAGFSAHIAAGRGSTGYSLGKPGMLVF